MKIYIKNMVCHRCKIVVQATFEKMGLHPLQVELGMIEIQEDDVSSVEDTLREALRAVGFDFLDDKKQRTIETIKHYIIDLVQHKNNTTSTTLSHALSEKLHQDYSALSHLFSEVEGITLEQYYILQKIEKVKELLVYDELSLSEIASQLHYSSVAYLSNQFKKVTGMTPSYFKNLQEKKRTPLDSL